MAREFRCAIVASAVREPRAISTVVSPPTRRSVNAARDSGVSRGVTGQDQPEDVVLDEVDLRGEVGHAVLLTEAVADLLGLAAQLVGPPERVDRTSRSRSTRVSAPTSRADYTRHVAVIAPP